MNKTSHVERRKSERNISDISLEIVKLFGVRLDNREGYRLDIMTYKELVSIGRNASCKKNQHGGKYVF